MYDAAFAQWFVSQGQAQGDEARARIERYRRLLPPEV